MCYGLFWGVDMVKPWKTLSSDEIISDQWITLRADRCQRDDGKIIAPFYVREAPDCVCILPLTDDGKVVLTTEYRHGIGRVVQGLPGGYADSIDDNIDATARRELQEETGFAAKHMVPLGAFFMNWSNQTNRIHYFLAEGLYEAEGQQLDETEDIRLDLRPFERVQAPGFLEQTYHVTCLLLAEKVLKNRRTVRENE